MVKQRGDKRTNDLFDWEPPKFKAEPAEHLRRGSLNSQIARAVSHTLSQSPLTREEIAEAMSDYLGEDISKNMLDAYASQARETHNITLERFVALIEVTGDMDLLGLIAAQFKHLVIEEKYGELIELHYLDEHQRDLDARKAMLVRKWRQ